MVDSTDPTRQVRGHVKWFDPVRGFGFIVSEEGGGDILLHMNVLRDFGRTSVVDGARIEANVQATSRGGQVVEVLSVDLPCSISQDKVEAKQGPLSSDDVEAPYLPARVKWYDRDKGFGFANVFGAPEDVFLHAEVLRRAGLADLIQGEAIALRVVDGRRGKHAIDIRPWD